MNSRSKASMKYNKENTVQVLVRLNKNTDADIIKRLDEVGNKQGYIKNLIRFNIKVKCY